MHTVPTFPKYIKIPFPALKKILYNCPKIDAAPGLNLEQYFYLFTFRSIRLVGQAQPCGCCLALAYYVR